MSRIDVKCCYGGHESSPGSTFGPVLNKHTVTEGLVIDFESKKKFSKPPRVFSKTLSLLMGN